jgi:hypothetical protein
MVATVIGCDFFEALVIAISSSSDVHYFTYETSNGLYFVGKCRGKNNNVL